MNRIIGGFVVMACMFAGHANAQGCYESSILSPSPFMGNNEEIFKLADGSLWEVKYEYEYLYEYSPSVIICPSRGKLILGKKSLNVQLLSTAQGRTSSSIGKQSKSSGWEPFEETSLQGSISGTVEPGRIFKTTSGNVYEVTGLTLQLVLELQPEVTVLRNGGVYKLIVDGFDEPLTCKLLNSVSPTSAARRPPRASGVVESQIEGTFEGWDGETIFKLTNGQIWQQASYAYTYHYAYRPDVLIYLSGAAYRMKVEG